MRKLEILVFGKHQDILKTVMRLINNRPGWRAEGTMESEDVIEKCSLKTYDLLLLGGGISKKEEQRVRAELNKIRPEMKIIQHFGGGSGLLYNEIDASLLSYQNLNFNIQDNSQE